MKTKLPIILTVTFLFILLPSYGQWQKYIIDDNINLGVSVDVADMDGDTKLDLIVTNENGRELIWYQNNFPYWSKHIIDELGAAFAYCGDMDSNDTLDIVTSHLSPREMVWYENDHPNWTKHYIDKNPDGSNFMLVADFDNDDTLDVVTAGGFAIGGDVVWYENNHPNWTKHIIESGSGKYPCLNVIDIDGDGLLDLVATMNEEDKVVWFKNENKGQSWTKYTIDDNLNGAFGLNCYDIDGDDTMDVVATSSNDNEVIWYENHNLTWIKHIIDTNLIGATWPCVTDVDGDDTMDIIVGGINGDVVVWYKNNHPLWTKHLIDEDLEQPRIFTVSDVDGDKINDLIVPAGGSVVWYKNPHTSVAFTESMEVNPFYMESMNDTLTIRASLSNPENHQVNIHAIIKGEQFTYVDSLQLFDDGLHSDDDSSDNIWGNKKELSGLPEDGYEVNLVTYDITFGSEHYFHQPAWIINYGPVSVVNYTFTGSDTEPNPGDNIKLELTLKNNSLAATATSIEAKLISLDALISSPDYIRGFEDILPTESITSTSTYTMEISENCPVNTELPIEVNIYSYGNLCWIDTLYIQVEEPVNIKQTSESLTRIYPNPTNDVINIQIENVNNTIIDIYDITGKKIYSILPVSEIEKIDVSGFSKGIYLIKIKQANEVFVRKIVVK
ncbi:T9SS type A sorting domain-containing protein [Bacteroidota bacterium]